MGENRSRVELAFDGSQPKYCSTTSVDPRDEALTLSPRSALLREQKSKHAARVISFAQGSCQEHYSHLENYNRYSKKERGKRAS